MVFTVVGFGEALAAGSPMKMQSDAGVGQRPDFYGARKSSATGACKVPASACARDHAPARAKFLFLGVQELPFPRVQKFRRQLGEMRVTVERHLY
jgi:hypothetical protein